MIMLYDMELEKLIDEIKDNYKAKGIAILAVDKEGNTLYEAYRGYRDEEKKLPINEDTIFGLASISKSFTSLCIMKLVEEGLIGLNDPVSTYLPYYKGINRGEPVRIWHLLSHSGGYFPLKRTCIGPVAEKLNLKEDTDGDFALHAGLAKEGAKIVAKQMDEQQPTLAAPGEVMSYCNDGFGLLSEIIRLKGGEDSFADYVKKHILLPLGMDRSNAEFVINVKDENVATLYSECDGSSNADLDFHRHAFVLGGGGALKSTIRDFKNYLLMYLNDGKITNTQKKDKTSADRLLNRHSLLEMERPRLYHQPGVYYGFGLFTKELHGKTIYYHDGSLPGVSSHFAFSKDMEMGVVVLCNTEDVPVNIIGEGLLSVLMGYDAKIPRVNHRLCYWDEKKCMEVCGSYETAEGSAFTLMLEGNSLTLKRDDNINKVFTISANRLLNKGKYRDSFIDILRDEDDQVIGAKFGSRCFRMLVPEEIIV